MFTFVSKHFFMPKKKSDAFTTKKFFLKSKRFWLFILTLSGLASVIPFEFLSPQLEVLGVPALYIKLAGAGIVLFSAIFKVTIAFKDIPAQLSGHKNKDNDEI